MLKGKLKILGLTVLFLLIAPAFVSAGPAEFISDVIRGATDAARSVFRPLFDLIVGGEGLANDIFYAKSLFLILLFVVIFAVVRKIPMFERNKAISIIVAAIVSIFAVRFMLVDDFVEGVLLPYGTLGVAITIFIPFMIYFYFLHISGITGFVRRGAWVLYGIVFFVFWVSRWNSIASEANTIYILIVLAIILAFIFDKGIHRYFGTHEIHRWKRGAHQSAIARLQSEYMNILNVDTRDAEARRRAIEDQIRRLGGDLP
jgi:hypothetical protein